MSLISLLWIAFCVIVVIVILLSLLLRVVAYLTRSSQDGFLYYPSMPEGSNAMCDSPCKMGIANAEDVHIRSSDNVVLRGFMMWPTAIPTHGNRNIHALSKAPLSSAGSSALPTSPSPSTSVVTSVSKMSSNADHAKDIECGVTISCTGTGKSKLSMENSILTECRGSNSLAVTACASGVSNNNNSSGDGSFYFNDHTIGSRLAHDKDDSVLCSGAAMLATDDGIAKPAATDAVASSAMTAAPTCVLLYFHGNAGNVGHRIELARYFVHHLHCAVLMMDYRGYGLSTSVPPTQAGLENDAQACLDYLYTDRRVPHDRIFVMGSSLGGAVTIHLSACGRNANRVRGVVLENTFTSLSDMTSVMSRQVIQNVFGNRSKIVKWANLIFEYYLKPVALMLRWNSADLVQSIPCPILFLSGLQDEIVPSEQMHRLYMLSLKRSRRRVFATFPHGQHNDLMSQPKYIETIHSFITDVLQSSSNHDV